MKQILRAILALLEMQIGSVVQRLRCSTFRQVPVAIDNSIRLLKW